MIWFSLFQAIMPSLAGQLPPAPNRTSGEASLRPQLYVAQRSQDLGTIIEGDKVTATWMLENRGTADLVIEHTAPSCGCMVVQLTEKEKVIAPGTSLALKVEFDSTNRRDAQIKTISVHSNDPTEPDLRLDFRVNVDLLFEMEPAGMLNLRSIRRGSAAQKTLDIFPGPGRKMLTIQGIEIQDDAPLTFQSEPFEARGRTGQRIRFTVQESASLGAINGIVKIRLTVDGVDRERSYPVRGEIVADLTWLPRVLDATRQTSLPGKRLAPVTILSTEKTTFDVVKATAGPLFDVNVEPGKSATSGTEYTVTLTIREGAGPGPFASVLEIRTTSLDQPIVSIPVFGIIAAAVAADPPVVLLRDDGTPNGLRRRVKIQAATTTDLDITEVTCDQSAISVTVDREASSRYHHIRFLDVRLSGKLPAGTHQAVIRLATRVPGSERLEIPLTVEVASPKP